MDEILVGRLEWRLAAYIFRVCRVYWAGPYVLLALLQISVYFYFFGYLRAGTKLIEFNSVTKNLGSNL